VIVMTVIMLKLQPVKLHLALQKDKSAFKHLIHTVAKKDYRIGFSATVLLAIGGFMMMPFGSAFAVNNLHITQHQLPLLFMVAGVGSLLAMPLIGKLSDKMDKFTLFTIASFYMMVFVVVYTNLGPQALWTVMIFNVLMMAGIFGRMIPSTALATAIPDMQDRGAFMSINASFQQIAGGVAAGVAGLIVVQKDKHSPLQHYDTLGWIIVGISFLSIALMYRVNKMIKLRTAAKEKQLVKEEPEVVQNYEL